MDNRLKFLYFKIIVQGMLLKVSLASASARRYVIGKGCFIFRRGVTEWEYQSVYIDWTWNAQDVEAGRQIPRLSRTRTPITLRKEDESVPFCFRENRRDRELLETVP